MQKETQESKTTPSNIIEAYANLLREAVARNPFKTTKKPDWSVVR